MKSLLSFESNHIIEGTGIHTFKTEAAGNRHFIYLIFNINIKRALLFRLTDFTLPAVRPVKADAPQADMTNAAYCGRGHSGHKQQVSG